MGGSNSTQLEKDLGGVFPEGEHLVGFENKNNVCYSNVILHCLYYSENFRKQVLNYKAPPDLANDNPLLLMQEIFQQISNLKKKHSTMSTKKLMNFVKRKNEMFKGDYHQDTHEFLMWLMNDMNDTLVKQMKGQSTPNGTAREQKRPQTWLEGIFEGMVTSRTRCLNCQTVTEREEPYLDLSVDVLNNTSLTHSLKEMSIIETLKDDNKFFCDKCKGLQEAEKRVLIKSLPSTLVIHLKRFKYAENLRRMIKLLDRVAFPTDIRVEYQDGEDYSSRFYNLYGIIVHIGQGLQYGHYICLIKIKDNWFQFDDETITVADERMIVSTYGLFVGSAVAYMLFYEDSGVTNPAFDKKMKEIYKKKQELETQPGDVIKT